MDWWIENQSFTIREIPLVFCLIMFAQACMTHSRARRRWHTRTRTHTCTHMSPLARIHKSQHARAFENARPAQCLANWRLGERNPLFFWARSIVMCKSTLQAPKRNLRLFYFIIKRRSEWTSSTKWFDCILSKQPAEDGRCMFFITWSIWPFWTDGFCSAK